MWKVIYEGTFLNDHLHGVGTSNNLGVIYRGEFRHGSKTGYGRLSNMLGQYYEGYFEKGFPVSEGFEKKGDVYVYKDQNENKRVFRKRKG